MAKKYVIALDAGTTSSRAIAFDKSGNVCGISQRPIPQIYPQPGWVEHNPQDTLATQLGALTELLVSCDIAPSDIDSIGITNQRETVFVWDRNTGAPVYNGIVWQCRRTADMIAEICKDKQVAQTITDKTGLIPDAYFSASKIKWILDNVKGARERAEAGDLVFGTVDTWIIWALTYGAVHATDVTSASRTMLYNIHEGCWDQWLLDLFNIPSSMLPQVYPSSSLFGATANPGIAQGISICGVAGDQQSALFGQCCFEAGQAKNTYGTGCFLLMNTGDKACKSTSNLVTTIAASAPGTKGFEYALEGSVFIAGALVQWLRDELRIISKASDSEKLARSVKDSGGVYIVPAFTGLGAPYWKADARGAIYGITRGTTPAHLCRAALEAIAFEVYDLFRAMEADAYCPISMLNVDGGASSNNFLMQFQSDILESEIRRPKNVETTALGAAYLAGLYSGFWKDKQEIASLRANDDVFEPHMEDFVRKEHLAGWKRAIESTIRY
ncbi:MAG: glycerol kinase GlpK [Eggerthellaceae bacterium]|nr:glycerol kinase GlpK [Eggerthellaceae bacterium]